MVHLHAVPYTLSAICCLQSSPFPSIPQVILICDHLVHLPSLTVCFISLPSTSLIFSPSPHCSLFPSMLLKLHSHRPSPCFSKVSPEPGFPKATALFDKHCLPSPVGRCGRHLAEGNGWSHHSQKKRCPSSGEQTS